MPEMLLTIVRYAMMILAGSLVNRGIIDASLVDAVVGLGMALAAFVWFLYGKYLPERRERLADEMNRDV